jgi:uncharacterized membrane protein YfcA
MEQFLILTWPYTLSGALVGLLVGLTGVGGGSLMTPLLTLLFSVPPSVAVGTDLAFASITKGFGTAAHRFHGNVRWDIVTYLCIGSITTALFSLVLMKILGEMGDAGHQFIRISIGISVLLTALSLVFRKRMLNWIDVHPHYQLQGSRLKWATIFVGCITGVLVTVSSIGAGAIGATLILLLYPRLQPSQVAGTDVAYAVPLTAIAGLGHWWLGNVHFDLLAGLLLGSIPSIWLGAHLAKHLPERMTRIALITTLTLVGIKMVA